MKTGSTGSNTAFSTLLAGWLKLAIGVVVIVLFMFVAAPAMRQIDAVDRLAAHTEETGIDAGGYWWSDNEEFAPSQAAVRDALDYAPQSAADEANSPPIDS